MRRYTGWIALAVLLTATVAVGRWQARATMRGDDGPVDAARAAGWRVLEGSKKQEVCNSFGPMELKMAKTNVALDGLDVSFTFKHALWEGMDALDLYLFQRFYLHFPGVEMELMGITGEPGKYGFRIAGAESPVFNTFWFDLPTGNDIAYAEIPVRVYLQGHHLHSTHSTTPIGDKASATHSKECHIAEEWVIPADTTIHVEVGGVAGSKTITGDTPAPLRARIGGENIDADDWSSHMVGVKYAMSIEDIRFCGNPIDTSAYTARTWGGTAASVDKLWVEGFGGNSIGFWCSEGFYNGAYVYNQYPGGWINAPLSYDFSDYDVCWMDGTPANSVEVVCPALRLISTQEDVDEGRAAEVGKDMGPWEGTMADLKAKGRVTQIHGCYFWDTYDPDMTNVVTLYMKYDSMREQGMLTHPKPTLKVEGCMFGVTGTEESFTTSPVDGDYWLVGIYNTLALYTNGSFYVYALDSSGDRWGIGPDQSVPPYYTAEDGGPHNIYLFNDTDYLDDVIVVETGQKRFTGWAGLGPAASAQANPVDPDTSKPGFNHDGTLIFDCWGVDATDRTSEPYMRDIVTFSHRDWTGGDPKTVNAAGLPIYGAAHDHTDWVASDGVTVPDASGNFTVTAAGATLTLSPRSYYQARQAGTYVALPDRYWVRRADYYYGSYPTEEPLHEAPYDWRGWSYLKSAFTLPTGLTTTSITVTIEYYNDLHGVSDNHMTGGERNTGYAYATGDLLTYSKEAAISVVTGGVATFITDLYWATEPLALVKSIKFTFTDTGDYKIYEPALVSDQGDPQTGRVAYVHPVLGFVNHGGMHKFFESPRYAQGGFSSVYDGIFDRQLYIPDNAKANQHEYCFPTLNVLIGAKTGVDMTTNFALGAVPITGSCEAWQWSYSATAEAAHMKDADGTVLKTLNCYDIAPIMAGADIDVAVRCYQITCVRGLPYTFYGTHWVGGAGHGMVLEGEGERFRGRYPYADVGDLCSRPMGSEDEDDYTLAEPNVKADEHGHWHDGDGDNYGGAPTDGEQNLYEWAVRGVGFVSLGQFYTREYCAADFLALVDSNPFVVLDGRFPPWMVTEHRGNINCYRMDGAYSELKLITKTRPFEDGLHVWPSIAHGPYGWVYVAATNTDTGDMDIAVSKNGGDVWEVLVASLGAGLQYGTIWCDGFQIKVAGWADDKMYFASASNPETLERDVLDGTNTLLEVAAAPAAGGVIPRGSGCTKQDGQDIVAVGTATGTSLHGCRSYRTGFDLIA